MAVDCYRLLFFFFFKVVLFSETEGRSISLCKRERKVTLVIITKCSGSPGVIWRKRRQGPVECRSWKGAAAKELLRRTMTLYARAPQQMRVPQQLASLQNQGRNKEGRAGRRLPEPRLMGSLSSRRRAIRKVLWNHKIKKQVSAVGDVEMQISTNANRTDKWKCAITQSYVYNPKAAPSIIIWVPLTAWEQLSRGT